MVIKKRFGSESRDVLIMCLGNSGPVQAMGAMANGKTNRRQTTRRKRVNFDGGGEDEDASSNDEEEEEKERDGITLEDLHACVLDSECAAAKKFGCGTTRFKTMYALSNLLIVCWLFFIHFFFSTSDARWSNDMGHRRATRALFLSYRRISLSLSLCVQMSQTRHRAMAAPEITLAPGNVQELSRILQGRKRDTSYIAFWSFDFFFIQQLTTFIITSKKNTHHHNYRKTTKKKRTPLLPPQELCEKTTLEPCPQRQSKRMEEVHIVRKDLVHLRNYALKVVRSFFFFGVDFLFFLCVCFGVFFVSFLIKATLRLPFFCFPLFFEPTF